MTESAPARPTLPAQSTDPARAGRRRLILFTAVALLAGLDLVVKGWAEERLTGRLPVELGLVDLQLAFNPGVAFSLGGTLPVGVVLGATGTVTVGVAVVLWRMSRSGTLALQLPLTLVLAGAASNLADRAVDGVVTDYLHTGWFPTFNGADVLITSGAAALLLTSLRATPDDPAGRQAGGRPLR